MKPVICFGEALIDFLNTGTMEDGGLSLPNFRQYPGGAPANAAVAVAKLGGDAHFAGQVGDDSFGHFLKNALGKYGVKTDTLSFHPSAKTALAFVMINHEGDRSFSFYRDNSADLVFEKSQVSDNWFNGSPLFHFCSNTLAHAPIAEVTEYAVDRARAGQSIVSFDVNLRHNLWQQGNADRERVNKLVAKADLIKFAREELDYLAGSEQQAYIKRCFEQGVQLILITNGPEPVEYFIQGGESGSVAPPEVSAVDTTAAGDAFIGAMLFGISRLDSLAELIENSDRLQNLIGFATRCSAYTVARPGAFPALPDRNSISIPEFI